IGRLQECFRKPARRGVEPQQLARRTRQLGIAVNGHRLGDDWHRSKNARPRTSEIDRPMGERDPHRSRRVAAVDAAVRVIRGEDLLVVVPRTSPPARAPLAHSEPVTVTAALEQEAAEMEGGRISDLEPAAARVELGCQGEVADGGGESVTSARSTVAAGATAWPIGRASVATCLPSIPFQVKWMRSPAAQALVESLRTRRSRRTTPSIGGLCGTTVPAMRVAVAAALAGNPGKTQASSATSAIRRVIWRRDTLLVSNTRKNPRPLMKMIGRASS